MDREEVLKAYDREIRRDLPPPPGPGWRLELLDHPAPMVRMTAPAGFQWGDGIFWTDLDESNADAAIADAVAYFTLLGRGFEWKHHGYDQPADLPQRLRAAGFVPDEEESLLIGEVADLRTRLAAKPLPAGVTIRRLRADDEGRAADWSAAARLASAVYGGEHSQKYRELDTEYTGDRDAMSVWLAEAPDGSVVSATWVRFHAGTRFASLWGGSTHPQWRGRGIYQALVARRADEAADRGFRFLQVDCSADSRPILERLGMHALTSTTPYHWRLDQEHWTP